ncbi:hypothetical protein Glove_173g57 [Diversispora epigaea]|uniref:Uncharacterized protein n=1 Tax=Diversispora epigaea TaxID=1348612 RepID=A0A397IYQ4_9GLOM|nr:hypothetical protein Glove_173g57 [Diversispora epigaea]
MELESISIALEISRRKNHIEQHNLDEENAFQWFLKSAEGGKNFEHPLEYFY